MFAITAMPVELGNVKLDQPECLHAQVQLSCAPFFALQRHGVRLLL